MKQYNEIAKANLNKYIYPPSWEKIDSLIKELGLSVCFFSRIYGVPFNTITQVKSGAKRLPPQYWHFFYEKIKPLTGSDYTKLMPNTQLKNRKQKAKAYKKTATIIAIDYTHDRISNI